jgi:hypothetical protein
VHRLISGAINMSNKAKLKPGEWWIVAGIVATLGGGIFLPIILFDHMPVYSALKADGMVTDGVVLRKESEQSTSSRRKRNNSSENHYFVIAFDTKSGVPFSKNAEPAPEKRLVGKINSGADIVASLDFGGSAKPANVSFANAQVRLNTGSFANFERYSNGDPISIVYLPNDPSQAQLTEAVRGYNPWPQLMIAVMLLIGGLAACWRGWVRRSGSGDLS